MTVAPLFVHHCLRFLYTFLSALLLFPSVLFIGMWQQLRCLTCPVSPIRCRPPMGSDSNENVAEVPRYTIEDAQLENSCVNRDWHLRSQIFFLQPCYTLVVPLKDQQRENVLVCRCVVNDSINWTIWQHRKEAINSKTETTSFVRLRFGGILTESK